MGIGSTVILYGYLSDQPAGNIDPLMFLQKNQTIESFLLGYYLAKLTPDRIRELYMMAEQLCTTDCKTVVNKRFGLH